MQGVGGIADDRHALAGVFARFQQEQRIGLSTTDAKKRPQAVAESLLQQGDEAGVVEIQDRRRLGVADRADHRAAVVAHGQQRHRPVRGEALVGDVAMG